jgi:hypothetical protein
VSRREATVIRTDDPYVEAKDFLAGYYVVGQLTGTLGGLALGRRRAR